MGLGAWTVTKYAQTTRLYYILCTLFVSVFHT